MQFYDNYVAGSRDIVRIGRLVINRQVKNYIDLMKTLQKTEFLGLGSGKGYFARAALDLGWNYQEIYGSYTLVECLKNQAVR